MKTTIQKLALAAAVCAAPLLGGAAANAGDYGGGLKGLRGAYVPVPAPAPIPDYRAKWYLRADVGVGFNADTSASDSGTPFGDNDFGYRSADGPRGFGSLAHSGGDEVNYSYSAGVGYYFSQNFRIDFTGEVRGEKNSDFQGSFDYDGYLIANPPPPPDTRITGDVRDETTLRSAVFMANAYYDFNRWGAWKPYVGAGLGFSVNEVNRAHRTRISSCPLVDVGLCDSGILAPTPVGEITASKDSDYTYSLAASLTAGVSYRISDVTSLDFNYRYLYVGSSDTSLSLNGSISKVEIDDQHEHYLRAGLRWDIN
ncbi:MAG: outer membrane beta-barrel protein [Alphaproteobacteria bacterium]|nr:outer membrane beta-barrel protein [Alphaproteobacteria bacterium]